MTKIDLKEGDIISRSRTFLSPILAAAGTAAAPSYTFTSDPDTGLYSYGANQIGITQNGSSIGAFSSGILYLTGGFQSQGNSTVNLKGNVADGATAVGATIGAVNDLTVAGSKIVSFVDNNTTEKAAIGLAGEVMAGAGTAALPSLSFLGDPNTGFYSSSDGVIKFTANGTDGIQFSGANINADVLNSYSATSLSLQGQMATGASAIGVKIGSFTNLTTSGAKLVSFINNNADEKAYVDYLGGFTSSQGVATSGTPAILTLTQGAHTGLTASTEVIGVNFNLGATKTWATGAISLQREAVISAPTYAFAGASTITTAGTFNVPNAPIAGANATITTDAAIIVGNVAWKSSNGTSNGILILPPGINNGIGAVTTRHGLGITSGGTVSLGDQTATLQNLASLNLDAITYSSTTLVRTVTNAATLSIAGPPANGGNITFSSGPYSLHVKSGISKFDGYVDLSGIAGGSTNIKITATTDTPTATWGTSSETYEVSTAPAGWLEIDVGGSPRYIPFWA